MAIGPPCISTTRGHRKVPRIPRTKPASTNFYGVAYSLQHNPANQYLYTYKYVDPYLYTDSYRYRDSIQNTDPYWHVYAYGDTHEYTNLYGYSNADEYADNNTNTDYY
jgi:hypothetical protein